MLAVRFVILVVFLNITFNNCSEGDEDYTDVNKVYESGASSLVSDSGSSDETINSIQESSEELSSSLDDTYAFNNTEEIISLLKNYRSPLKFLGMGDWGTKTYPRRSLTSQFTRKLEAKENSNHKGNNKQDQQQQSGYPWNILVSEAMAAYASVYPADFLIALGDNFYNNGVTSVYDDLWQDYYHNIYYQDSLKIPWYVILGNHDYGSNREGGDPDAQIEYQDGRWNAGHCYLQSYMIPNSNAVVDIVFIDSTLVAPEETYQTSTASGVSEEQQKAYQTSQLSCLEAYLAGSTAHFLLVAGHYPIFSTGKNGPGDMESMVETVFPLLAKYDVDAYLCGHDHMLEHLVYSYYVTDNSGSGTTKRSMDFIISGAAGKPDNQLYTSATSAATMMFAAATGGFIFSTVTPKVLSIRFVDYTGTELYAMYRKQVRYVPDDYYYSSQTEDETNEDTISTGGTPENLGEVAITATDQMKGHINRVYAAATNMSRSELIEICIVCGLFSFLVLMLFLVTNPKFSVDKSNQRRNTPPVPAMPSSGWRSFFSRKKTKRDCNDTAKTKKERKKNVVSATAAADAAAALIRAGSVTPVSTRNSPSTSPSEADDVESNKVGMPKSLFSSDLDGSTSNGEGWTRKQYFAARREALSRSRHGRSRRTKPHPILLHSNIHDTINLNETMRRQDPALMTISGNADFLV